MKIRNICYGTVLLKSHFYCMRETASNNTQPVVHNVCCYVISVSQVYQWFTFWGEGGCDSPPSGPWPPHSRGFLDHTQQRTAVSRTPLDKWSVRRPCLTTHNTHNRQTSLPLVGFEPTISAGERPQTYALDCAATWTGASGSLETFINGVWIEISI